MFWDISNVPCKYAITYTIRERKGFEDPVDESYNIEGYKLTYNVVIYLVRDS